MKLIVIVICLLCERFITHASGHKRFNWFSSYANAIQKNIPQTITFPYRILLLALTVLPIIISMAFVLYLTYSMVFGLIYLFLHLIVFYYCLGPQNPFYPKINQLDSNSQQEELGNYFAEVNGQLFAVIFWYIVLGPLGVLTYRLISLSKCQTLLQKPAQSFTDVLDWVPAKITALLYLLVGNFQIGFQHFARLLFTPPHNNETILSVCGLHAVGYNEQEKVLMPQAETLVEHAAIGLLVLLSIFTMIAWL